MIINRTKSIVVFFGNIFEYCLSIFGQKHELTIPVKIKNYFYIKTISHSRNSDTAVLLYSHKNKKVVVKIWQGSYKNASYYGLVNEKIVYSVLSKTINSTSRRMPVMYKNVHIPTMIDFIDSGNQVVLILEWIDAKSLESYSESKIVNSYKKVIGYLDYLTNNMSKKDKSLLEIRRPLYYILTYPFYLIISLMLNFKYSRTLLNGLKVFLNGSLEIINDSSLTFVHRDLNFKNIIVKGSDLYLIDFQFSALTLKVVEYVNTLRYCWDKDIAKNKLLSVAQTANNLKELKAMVVIFGTHGLTARNFNKVIIRKISNYISTIIKI